MAREAMAMVSTVCMCQAGVVGVDGLGEVAVLLIRALRT